MMERILKVVLVEARKHSAERVLEVGLMVGELTLLNPDQLHFAFEVLSKGTLAENAQLNIEEVPIRVRCSRCGYEGSIPYKGPEDHLGYRAAFLKCAVCGCRDLMVISGRECMIKDLKLRLSPRRACSTG